MLIRSYIRIQATLLRIAAPANFPTSPSALYRVFDTFPTLFLESGPHLQPHHNGGAALNVLTLTNLIHLLLSSLCSQSATCSFLFRVLLSLAGEIYHKFQIFFPPFQTFIFVFLSSLAESICVACLEGLGVASAPIL